MHQIVYTSLASNWLDERELDSLRDVSAQRNAACAVTGLLLYDGIRFLQALEGAECDVRQIMERITIDRRHSCIIYLSDQETRSRQFGTWSMSCKCFGEDCDPASLLAEVKADVDQVSDPALKATFIGFALLSLGLPRSHPRQSVAA